MRIFTLGYQSGWSLESLRQEADRLGAVVVDVRLKPWSQVEQWRKLRLDVALADYRHVPQLGNLHYKGGPVKIQGLAVGISIVSSILEIGDPVILLCGCWNLETCHRVVVAEALAEATGEPWSDLGRPKKPPDPQLKIAW